MLNLVVRKPLGFKRLSKFQWLQGKILDCHSVGSDVYSWLIFADSFSYKMKPLSLPKQELSGHKKMPGSLWVVIHITL
jgi:hypothetical protein